MIVVSAYLKDGLSRIVVEGHDHQSSSNGGVLCSAVSVITDACIAALQALAEEYPDSIEFDLQEET